MKKVVSFKIIKKLRNQTHAAVDANIVQKNRNIFHTFEIHDEGGTKRQKLFYNITLKKFNFRFCHISLEKLFIKIIYYDFNYLTQMIKKKQKIQGNITKQYNIQ